MAYVTVSSEGGLFPADLLEGIASGDSHLSGQRAVDFGLPEGRRLSDEIQPAFSAARSYWDAFQQRLVHSRDNHTTLTRAWMKDLLELLGFTRLTLQRASAEAGSERYFISHRAGEAPDSPPVHIVAVEQDLDKRDAGARRSPHALVQEYLNRSDCVWGIVSNGRRLRLLRNSVRLSKPTYLEFDLEGMVEDNLYSEFVLLYRLIHASRLPTGAADAHQCLLEGYYEAGVNDGDRVRDKLREGVEQALQILGTAFLSHPGSQELRRRCRDGRLDATAYYRQLLRLVYRLLFLMVAEERKLMFAAEQAAARQAVYSRYYGIARLRERAERWFEGDRQSDLWIGLRQTFEALRDDDRAGGFGLSALDGELFGWRACAELEDALCNNESLLSAIRELSTFQHDGLRRRVNYAGLDVEEFGSVYESLLDFHPRLQLDPPRFELVPGSERKQTGSYYTPPELVRELIESALAPVIRERLAGLKTREQREEALLGLRVCDPASGSGHFLLAAARRIARELARARSGEDEPAPGEYRLALRDVIRNCLYAVDKNPLAVDLCKVALWMEGHCAGLPLGFLDHHVKCGDSLVGVADLEVLNQGIPNDAFKPVTGDDKGAARYYRERNSEERKGVNYQLPFGAPTPLDLPQALAQDFQALASLEERTPADVQAKEALYQSFRSGDWLDLKAVCDLWTGAFFLPLQQPDALNLDGAPTTAILYARMRTRQAHAPLVGRAMAASQQQRFFHWPLEFPDVFDRGGFDVVLGNPPWERIKLQEREFFAARDPEIARAPNKAARQRLIEALARSKPALAAEFEEARRLAEGESKFVRASGRFPLTGRGDINTYSIFTETARSIIQPLGRVGIIAPSGIATDDTTKDFFADLVDRSCLVSLYDFENREAVFPDVHRSYKFCLLTLCGSGQTMAKPQFAFFLYRAEHIRDEGRCFTLSAQDFRLINPNTLTCPAFRSGRDAGIARRMYQRAGVLINEAEGDKGNPWGISFLRMFDMSNDSGIFRTFEQLTTEGWRLEGNIFVRGDQHYLPLYEAKLFHQYDHRYATFAGVGRHEQEGGSAREVTTEEKADPRLVVIPRYWVPAAEVQDRLDKSKETEIMARRSTLDARRSTLDALANLARESLSARSLGRPTRGQGSSP